MAANLFAQLVEETMFENMVTALPPEAWLSPRRWDWRKAASWQSPPLLTW